MDKDRLLAGKRYSLYKDPFFILIVILLFVLLCRVLFVVRYIGIYVYGSSMSPTLNGATREDVASGDYLYADRYADPDYGDIVVVEKPDGDRIIKRVIALGGDSVYLEGGVVYVMYAGTDDYVALKESYVAEENNDPYLDINNTEVTYVPEGYMYLLGDNRNNSNDSRGEYGCFSEDSLVGVITDWSLKYKEIFTAVYTFFAFGVT